MAPNPISFCEIEAYSRLTNAQISPWEAAVIRRLDMAALAAFDKRRPKPGGQGSAASAIPAADAAGVKGLLRSMKPKKRATVSPQPA